jgi:hypothetical protein
MHESYPLDGYIPFSITEITGTHPNTAYANMGSLYSTPVLLDTIVKEDTNNRVSL